LPKKKARFDALRKLLILLATLLGTVGTVVSLTIIVSCEGDGGVRIPHMVVYNDGFVVRSISPNNVVEVRGTGFRPGEAVHVGVLGFPNLTEVSADKEGRFRLPALSPGEPGRYTYVGLVSLWGEWVIAVSSSLEVLGVVVGGGSQ
jgi:hypothetical protein